MDVSAVSSLYPAQESAATKLPGEMGKEDFLMLLVEQLKSQDPLNPQDPSEFTAQLAQFSSLEQLFNMGDALQGLTMLTASLNNAQATSLLGREIEVSGAQIVVHAGQPTEVHYALPADAATATLTIYDERGVARRTIDLGPRTAGDQVYAWDGRDDKGAMAADGTYTYKITAGDASGNSLAVQTFRRGIVTGVHYQDGITLLEMDGQRIPITDIQSVRIQETGE